MPSDHTESLRLRLVEQILRVPASGLLEIEQCVARVLATTSPAAKSQEERVVRDWPHAPLHRLSKHGTYIVTAGTANKEHFFQGNARLDYLEANLLAQAKQSDWQLEAWAVFSNHYHFIAHAGPGSQSLKIMLRDLHGRTSRWVNDLDHCLGRQVWFNYWDTQLTYEKSYLATLHYVHQNPVKHGLAKLASQYPWCSAAWFEKNATRAQVKTVYSFKIDRLKVLDDFEPV